MIKRRFFLRLSSIATLGLLLPISYCSSHQNTIDELLSIPSTLSDIFSKDLINEFGKKYLNLYSKIKDKEGLVNKLLENNSSINVDKDVLKRTISIKIKSDFDNDRVIKLDGWFLSETELSQCGLSYLINK